MSSGKDISKKSVTLVLGGARSGKSSYALELASHFRRVTFIATAQPSDSEMRRKIARHRAERPKTWKTVEAHLNLDETIRSESKEADVLVIDCFTFYVSNLLYGKKRRDSSPAEAIEAVCKAMQASKAQVVAVSNEVGSGIVPAYKSGRLYRDLLGKMNQQAAQVADRVVLMVAGIPLVVKGSLS